MAGDLTADLRAIAKFASLMAIAPGLVQKETANGITRAAYIIQRPTQRNTPVRTGTLRRSWTVEKATPSSFKAVLGTAVPYAPFVEFGTRRMAGRGMLQRALDDTRAEVAAAYADIPGNVLQALQAGGR